MSKTIVTDQGDRLVIKIYESGVTLQGTSSGGGTWFFGTSDPVNTTGTNGDYFHRTDNDTIFGPKSSGAWGSAISLGGSQGNPGQDGKSILNGSSDPTTEGSDGDFYINTSSNQIFGPKTSGAWGSGTNIIGPQGNQGPIGPQGDTGPQGNQGVAGNDGSDGNDGSNGATIITGSSNPTTEGNDGDYFLNTSSNDFFGPKTTGSWGSAVANFTGSQGPAGPGGSATQWRQSNGVPSNSLGTDNDFYVDTDNWNVYQKQSGAYVQIGNIQGAVGATGPQGSSGSDGATGPSGSDGRTVLNGTIDPTTEGTDGDFYINTSSNTLFGPKSSGSWPSGISLVGPQGAQGDEGPQGPAGPGGTATQWRQSSGIPLNSLGVDNDFYVDSDNWNIYQKQTGTYVQIGNIKGADGNDGATGAAGNDGSDGRTILNGAVNPTTEGVDGDFYINTVDNTLFGPKSGSWPSGVSIVGPQGATGATGANGNDGTNGTNGSDGADGTDGAAWFNGSGVPSAGLGVDGDYYINTDNGDVYIKSGGSWSVQLNITGPTGATGANGADGAQGPAGNDGADATSGTGTGTALNLALIGGTYYNMSSASSATTFTFTGAVAGGFAKTLINSATEPTVTGATKQYGPSFQANTDMFLNVWNDGTNTWFFFERIT